MIISDLNHLEVEKTAQINGGTFAILTKDTVNVAIAGATADAKGSETLTTTVTVTSSGDGKSSSTSLSLSEAKGTQISLIKLP